MAKESSWNTASRSAMGIFEYRVMAFGLEETPANFEESLMPFVLKGSPAAFEALINAYLELLLSHGITPYLDDVLNYRADLGYHVSLLRQVLSILVTHQFHSKFSNLGSRSRNSRTWGTSLMQGVLNPHKKR